MKKIKIFLSVLVMLLISGGVAWAVVSTLNGQTGQTQTFSNDANVVITSANDTHSLGWSGLLPISRGGTGRGSFTDGSLLFFSGASISQDNTNLFWDDTNNRLGVGTQTPSEKVDVSGNLKATQIISNTVSATGTNQSLSLNPTGTGVVSVGGDSMVVARLNSQPASASTGQIYFDRTLGRFRGYNGRSWVNLSSAFPSNGLVSFWRFNEQNGNATDSQGSNALTNLNTATFTTAKINNGTDLERDSSQSFYITDGAQSGLDILGDISLSMWIKPESTPSSTAAYQLITKAEGTSNQRSYQFIYQDNGSSQRQLRVIISNDGTANQTDVTKNISDLSTSSFSHVVFTVDIGGNITYYINGSSQGTSTESAGSIYNSSADFKIGGQGTTPTNNNTFDGVVDEVGVWNRVLTAEEIATLYNNGEGFSY